MRLRQTATRPLAAGADPPTHPPPAELALESASTLGAFDALADEWDELVRAMPRPSPFMLHSWLREWWRHYGDGADMTVHLVRRGGRLVGALPAYIRSRRGVRVAAFIGAADAWIADLLLARGAEPEVGLALVGLLARSGADFVDFGGLPGRSRLAATLNGGLRTIERVEAPVLELDGSWEDTYRAKFSGKARQEHRRRRRRLEDAAPVRVAIARSWVDLEPALDAAFRLHARRWAGRPDGSGLQTERGRMFYRSAYRALAGQGVIRLGVLRVGERPVAFASYFLLGDTFYAHRLAFDPEYERFSPGLLCVLDVLEAAAAEGVRRFEFLGGAEELKTQLMDRFEPLHEGIGLATTPKGHVGVAARMMSIRARKRLRRSAIRRVYFKSFRRR
jgi:CelD/BcsL family acetyltransferase involved in cellulose biosynthesis